MGHSTGGSRITRIPCARNGRKMRWCLADRRVMTLTEARLLFPTFVKRVDLAAEIARLKGNHGLVVRDGLEQAGLNKTSLAGACGTATELAKVVLRPVWRGVARLLGQIGRRLRERARAVVSAWALANGARDLNWTGGRAKTETGAGPSGNGFRRLGIPTAAPGGDPKSRPPALA